MVDSPLGLGKLSPSRLPISFSTSSLDIKLSADAHRMQSLLSESATLDSLCSDYTDTEACPTFPLSKLPHFTLIGLGDQLKFFSLPMRQAKDKLPAMISSPTSPRLKHMLKECLNIEKWVENSTGWRPPGHVPWESIKCDVARTWIPEGSILSPEEFSLALVKAKDRDLKHQESSFVLSTIDRGTAMAKSVSQVMAKTDILDMMLELSNLKLYFEDFSATANGSDINISDELPLPSLVVSDSHFTFPIPLESSSTLAGGMPSTISRRRRRKLPPALIAAQSRTLYDVPYPGIPPAFLGLSLSASPVNEILSTLDDKPCLRFEEMITNLRLQCSTMELKTPPADISWNSRSAILPQESTINSVKSTSDIFQSIDAQPINKPKVNEVMCSEVCFEKAVDVSPTIISPLDLASTDNIQQLPKFNNLLACPLSTVTRNKPDLSPATRPPQCPAPGHLSSAVVKMSATKQIPKSVRFALTRRDLEKDTLPLPHRTRRTTHVGLDLPEALIETTPEKSRDAARPSINSQKIQRSRLCTQVSQTLSHKKTRNASLNQPRSHSLFVGSTKALRPELFTESEDINVEPSGRETGRSTPSLGRHSLSRIIKGPMFPGRDYYKRATIFLSDHEIDENFVRRESQSQSHSNSAQKKSRMPIPLRNILTRFK